MIRRFNQTATAAAFRFLRHPSRPNAPRPVAKSGSAGGSHYYNVIYRRIRSLDILIKYGKEL